MMLPEKFEDTAQIGRHFVLSICLICSFLANILSVCASDMPAVTTLESNIGQIDAAVTLVTPGPTSPDPVPSPMPAPITIAAPVGAPVLEPEALPNSPSLLVKPSPDIAGGVTKKSHIEPPFKITGSFSRRFQEYSGITASSEFLTNIILHRTLSKLFGGKIRIRVKTYSFTDLWHLKVKKATIILKGSHYKDIPLGNVEIQSFTPFWFVFAHRRLEVKNPSLFSFKMTISESNLDKILHSSKATNSLRALRLDLSSMGGGMSEQRIQMHEPEVTINDDSIMVKARLATQGCDPSTAVLMTISGKPKLHGNDHVFLEEIKIDSADITDPEKFSKFVEHLINPLINLHRFDKPNFALRLDDVSVKSKSVSVTGRILIGPRIQNQVPN